jgi:hypothetical protein
MSVRINYLEIRNQPTIRVGEIEFFDSYKLPSKKFPYFHLGQKNMEISYQNWPNLTSYLFEKTISVIDINKNLTDTFQIYSFSNLNGESTLTFNDINALRVLVALIEDANTYYLENNSYSGWNKTLTFLQSITIGGITYFTANSTYYINSITVNFQNATASITLTSGSLNSVNTTTLTGINVEFGLFRIPGKSNLDAVYYTATKGKFLCNNNNNVFINGLNFRSQLLGHTHDHQHNLNNHSHTMAHTHGLNNHTHSMNHTHNYTDNRSSIGVISLGDSYLKTLFSSLSVTDQFRNTSQSTEFTAPPNNNVTGEASITSTNSISHINTSNISAKTINNDGGLYSNNLNFKVNSKIIPESYTIYAYFYGETYNG